MSTYRVYFHECTRIVGRHDFTGDDDQSAVTMADVLCDACSDRCDSFEVWQGDRRVVGPTPHSLRCTNVIMGGSSKDVIVRCEEAIQQSQWFIARSEKLLERLSGLRGGSVPPEPQAFVERDVEQAGS